MMTMFIAAAVFFAAAAVRWFLDRSTRTDTVHLQGRIELTAAWNTGAAFALPIPVFAVRLPSAAALGMAWMQRRCSRLGAGLILGGGGANLYERLRHGKVYDYMRFPKAWGRWKHYIYNLADIAIFLGAMIMLFAHLCRGKRKKVHSFAIDSFLCLKYDPEKGRLWGRKVRRLF